jgi:hypothetical protein
MAKFAKGDKVESVKTGAKGVVDEVYGDEKYAVLFDGATNPDRVEGFQIKAANGCAKNAKFKVGDKVKVKGAGVETIKAVYPKGKGSGLDPTQVDMSVDWYETDGSGMIADEDIVGVANSAPVRSTNSVVQNAKDAEGSVIRVGDIVISVHDEEEDNPKEYKVKGISGSYVYLDDGRSEHEKDLLVYNSRKNYATIHSTNRVVQNAINARRARNAIDFNGASAKVQKAFEGRIDKLVRKFKNDLSAVGTDVAKEYKKYQSIEPDSATLILEVGDWIESLKGSVDDSW